MKELFNQLGAVNYQTQLVYGDGALVENIIIAAGEGAIEAGTIVYEDTTGFYKKAAAAQIDGAKKLAVLMQDVNAAAGLNETVPAYTKGTFAAAFVKLSGGTLSIANKAQMHNVGLTVVETVPAAGAETTIDTIRRKITYKANGGTGDDYIAYADNGATYTILANSVTGFTAPATKAFSKWNTAADGSGTNYSAAGTYTASADLVLYAVWA